LIEKKKGRREREREREKKKKKKKKKIATCALRESVIFFIRSRINNKTRAGRGGDVILQEAITIHLALLLLLVTPSRTKKDHHSSNDRASDDGHNAPHTLHEREGI